MKHLSSALAMMVALFVVNTEVVPVRAEVVNNSASYSMNLFSDVDGVNVFTQYIDYSLATSSKVIGSFQWVHDKVIIPGIEASPGTPEAIDAVTSASRPIVNPGDAFEDYIKTRDSLQGTVDYKGANASYYVSTENDYFAQMFAAGYNRDFLDDNFNLSGGMSYSWDDITPIELNGGQGSEFRNTLHGNLVATQVLSTTTVLRVGVEINDVTGQQHNPYRSVYVGGGIEPELHPDWRSRRDVFLKLSQFLGNESSLKFDFRYYDDDWQVSSQTYGLRLNQRISPPLTVRYRYRYYSQASAWFYREDYRGSTAVDGYQTADYRLGQYGAHLFGGHITWRPESLFSFLDNAEVNITFERYFNSNNFTANIFETSLRVTF